MTPSLLDKLIAISPKRLFPKNALLIQEGDLTDTIYILLKGRVRAFSIGADGKEVTFSEYFPIELFGEMSLDGQPRSSTVQAMQASECAVVNRALLEEFISQEPTFAFELTFKAISRARQATDSTRNLALLNVYGRLKVFLESVPHTMSSETRTLQQRYTQQEIAARIGASREMVNKLMKDLESGGYILFDEQSRIAFKRIPDRW